MTTDHRCQAAAMDADAMLGAPADLFADGNLVPPCDELAEVHVGDFVLCAGCAEAFEALVVIGGAALRKRGGDMLYDLFPPEWEP